jgi:hypothetical protein
MDLQFLDDTFPMVALYRAFDRDDRARRDLALELLAHPQHIAEAFAATRAAILPYENAEAFYATRTHHPIAESLTATKDVALRLAPTGSRHQIGTGPDDPHDRTFDFVYLDRELVTTRTTAARRHPDVQRPDHQLRLDLLLASPDRIPIVGEIKIKRDRDLSYALIQALACVSLLSTPHQSNRLSTHYAPHLAGARDENPPFEIYLIAVPRTDRNTYLSELDTIAQTLAGALVQRDEIGSIVREITKITAELADSQLRLTADWRIPASS